MDPPQGGTVPETAPDGRRLTPPLYVVVLLAVVLLINYIDRGALGTAGPLIQRDLHLTNGQYGMLSSAFFWMYALIQIPVGAIAERFGAHRVLIAGLVVWATATAFTGITSTFSTLIALRMMLGLGESVGFPTVSKLLAAVVPVKGLGLANGIVAFGYLIGPGVGVVLAGILIDYVSWRGTFLVFGVCSLLWLIPWLAVRLPRIATQRSDPSAPTLGMVLSQRGLWGTSLGLFSSNYMWYFILFWLPGYLVKERGFSMHAMEHVATAGYLVNGLSAFIVGWAIDRYVVRGGSANFAYKLIMFIAHAACVPCMLAMGLGTESMAIAGMFGFQIMMGASSPGMYAMSQILAGPRASGRWVGIQNSLGNLPGAISPWVTGIIVDRTGHFALAFVAAALVSVLGIVGWIGIVPKLAPIKWGTPRGVAPPVEEAAPT
ncbi:MAG TPA: MFS transporter [Steroidobacteraceae bacterium]